MKYDSLGKIVNDTARQNIHLSKDMIVSIIEKELGLDLDSLKSYILYTNITLTSEEIVNYLWELSKGQKILDRRFALELDNKYSFEPFTLEYFTTYLDILKKKTIKLLNLIDNINNEEYRKVFQSLDITIYDDGIHYKDVIRLCKPIVYNVLEIREISKKANDKRTYITTKINKDALFRDGWTLREIYPLIDYQDKKGEALTDDGYIELSDRQKEEMIKLTRNNISYIIGLLENHSDEVKDYSKVNRK